MSEPTLGAWRAQYDAIHARLEGGLQPGERDAVKGEIVGLFKAVEQQITDLTALKEEIRVLVDKWKAAAQPSWAGCLSSRLW